MKQALYYIVESANWSIRWDGRYTVDCLNRMNTRLKSRISLDARGVKDAILHFGSRNVYLPSAYKDIDGSNKVVFTWFHGTDADSVFIDSLAAGVERADFVHTSCSISRNDLVRWGVPEDKIRVIPIGVDTRRFHPMTEWRRAALRRRYHIPSDSIVIGSFQKDGNGWGMGNVPKLIKGPDVFCDAVEKIHRRRKVFVVLTGPARGYVMSRLAEMGIPYAHFYLKDPRMVATFYHLVDVYLCASRTEGGPKAVVEALASGVPLVTTDMGMAHDMIVDGQNGIIRPVEDAAGLADGVLRVAEDAEFRERLVRGGLATVHGAVNNFNIDMMGGGMTILR